MKTSHVNVLESHTQPFILGTSCPHEDHSPKLKIFVFFSEENVGFFFAG